MMKLELRPSKLSHYISATAYQFLQLIEDVFEMALRQSPRHSIHVLDRIG